MAEIFLIEDNPADIVLTQEAFKECKTEHNISYVNDGIEAIKYLKKADKYKNCRTPDIILLDLNLPKKDGRQVLAEIRADEKLKNIPVIILSTSKNENDIYASYELNANCYIPKPVELDSFFEIIACIERFWLEA
ncbi:MAG: response regulator [Ignavibacteriae bacterium]|nr:MAG: response regulator [Ignavibacteriota bacterium]